LTLGQYLAPTLKHVPVARYLPPAEFNSLAVLARSLGFAQVASGPFVRSSYHADEMVDMKTAGGVARL
jgi:lipoic acid synthetase